MDCDASSSTSASGKGLADTFWDSSYRTGHWCKQEEMNVGVTCWGHSKRMPLEPAVQQLLGLIFCRVSIQEVRTSHSNVLLL